MAFLRITNFVFAIITAILIEHTFEHPESEERNPKTDLLLKKQEMFNKCIVEYPLSDDLKNKMLYYVMNDYLPEGHNFKCFMKCAFEEFSLTDDDGAMNKTKLLSFIIPEYQDMAMKVALSCLPTTVVKSDACETAYNFVKCAVNVERMLIPVLAL